MYFKKRYNHVFVNDFVVRFLLKYDVSQFHKSYFDIKWTLIFGQLIFIWNPLYLVFIHSIPIHLGKFDSNSEVLEHIGCSILVITFLDITGSAKLNQIRIYLIKWLFALDILRDLFLCHSKGDKCFNLIISHDSKLHAPKIIADTNKGYVLSIIFNKDAIL